MENDTSVADIMDNFKVIQKDILKESDSNNRPTVVVGMSGGVDSSVTASILKEMNFNVIGVTLVLNPTEGSACSNDMKDAKKIADFLGIEHHVLHRENKFRENIIDSFIDGYKNGITPSPCVTCNRKIKMREMIDFADSIGAGYIATGHYAITEFKGNKNYLYKGKYLKKDQTYFLSQILREDLNRLICPLGKYTKPEVRKIAEKMSLCVSNKSESQDICFVKDGNYVDTISQFEDIPRIKGLIKHIKTGKVLGEHDGLISYTIGQRKGIKISYTNPLYVCKIDKNTNTLFVGEESFLYGNEIIVKDFNYLVEDSKEIFDEDVMIKVRASANVVLGSIIPIPGNSFRDNNQKENITINEDRDLNAIEDDKAEKWPSNVYISLNDSVRGITPGQVCAVYRNDRLLGGGIVLAGVLSNISEKY